MMIPEPLRSPGKWANGNKVSIHCWTPHLPLLAFALSVLKVKVLLTSLVHPPQNWMVPLLLSTQP